MWLFLQPALACTFDYPSAGVVWPRVEDPLPAVASVVVRNPSGEAVSLSDASGVAVAAEVVALPDGYALVRPDAPLTPGPVEVSIGGSSWSLEVVDEAVAAAVAPVPVWRDLATSLDYRGSACGGPDRVSVDHARYRLCGDAVLFVAASGDELPADDVATAELIAASDEDTLDLAGALGAGDGWSGSVWLGAMDATGHLAWAEQDTFTMPEDDHRVLVEAQGFARTGGGTPTSFDECPAWEGWGPEQEQVCPTRKGVPDCRPVGCSTSGLGTLSPALLLATLVGLLGRPTRADRPARRR